MPAMDLDVATATATELAEAIRDRRISSRELLEYLIARGDRLNPALNAIVAWDVDRARAAAAAADEATARGELAGPLHGLPMTVKDVFETAGPVTTSGAPELARHVPQQDATAVARLRAAGAIIVAGPMARGVGDLRTALGIVAGPLPQEAAGLAPRA